MRYDEMEKFLSQHDSYRKRITTTKNIVEYLFWA